MTQPPSNPPSGDDDKPWQPPSQEPPQQPQQPQHPRPGYGGGGQGGQAPGHGGGQQPYGGGGQGGGYGGQGGQGGYGGGGQGGYGGGGHGAGQAPYGGAGQDPYGSLPSYGGPLGGYADPAAGLASPWRRLGGIIIDYIIVGIVGWLITLPFGELVEVTGPSGDQRVVWHAGGGIANLIVFVLALAYYTILQGKFGQTVGKMAVGTRVVRAEDGGPVGYGAALLRTFVMYVLWAICCIGGIVDGVWLFADSRRQTLHDKAGRTVVMRVDPDAPNPYQDR
ncbi:RDD family protein [Actinomadura rupiterrae]|uniref:RDD family protein n=1 Tax=Actinomadura rupiterrae TaxID=559627 RepID=UPI0020A43F81|nr:RDD family protein [Actinomadura rupiterrae]MCP2336765.1 putative RDD family membrane protein YckC [Actinomadura rupiterrae]